MSSDQGILGPSAHKAFILEKGEDSVISNIGQSSLNKIARCVGSGGTSFTWLVLKGLVVDVTF